MIDNILNDNYGFDDEYELEDSLPYFAHRYHDYGTYSNYIPQSTFCESRCYESSPTDALYNATLTASDNGSISRRYDSGKGVSMTNTHYYRDYSTWYQAEVKEGKKTVVKTLTDAFQVSGRTIVMEYGKKEPICVRIDGEANGSHSTFLKYEDYVAQRFYPNLNWVKKRPGCTRKQANDLIYDQIQKAPKYRAEIYPRQGFIELSKNEFMFGAYSESMGGYAEIMPDSVKMKKLAPLYGDRREITRKWQKIYGQHPKLITIGLTLVAVMLKFLLEEMGVRFNAVEIFAPSSGVDEEKLKAMLCSYDTTIQPIPNLELSQKELLAYLTKVWDSPALFVDHSFADESGKVEETLRKLIKAVRGGLDEGSTGRNIIAVISENAGYIASRVSPESVIILSMEGVKLDYSSEYIHQVTSEMEALLVDTIIRRIDTVQRVLRRAIADAEANRDKFKSSEAFGVAIYLYSAKRVLESCFNVSLVDYKGFNSIISYIDNQKNSLVDSDTAITRDFSKIASERFRSGNFKAIHKRNGLLINDTGNTAIISGNRAYLTGEMIADVLSQMSTTHNMKSLLNALAHYNALDAKDGKTHPLDAHTSSGKAVRLYLYDISADILDVDVVSTLNNLEGEAYMLSEQEIPKKSFLPLLRDVNGRVAGKVIDYDEEDNDHSLICGQSGFGKTYLQSQFIAKRCSLGNKVVAFDTSDSFTYKALCHNLSKRFVNENVTFYNIDSSAIPIDIFRVAESLGVASKVKYLVGVIKAGIGELSVSQTNALRCILEVALAVPGEQCFAQKMKNVLDSIDKGSENIDEKTIISLRNRLEPLLGDIIRCRMSKNTWDSFLASSKPIVIIHTNGISLDNNHQIIDMLLLTMFAYQNEDFTIPLDVFIDEIQNQNFSSTSSIRKIMKEGRKIHMAFFGSTQDYYPRKTGLGSTMGKAGTQVFLRPTQDSEQAVVAELRWKKADLARFDSMDRGDIIVKGALYNKEKRRNMQTTLSGHVDDFLPNDIIDESDE